MSQETWVIGPSVCHLGRSIKDHNSGSSWPGSLSLPLLSGISKMAFTKVLALSVLLMVMAVNGEPEKESEASDSFVERARRQKDTSFDFFFFVQQWPGSFCDSYWQCCFPITGKPGPFFGIHGLWPNRNDGTWPYACTNEQFDVTELQDVIAHLNKNWGSLACKRGGPGTNEKFWEHEWETHGTCSNMTQHEYFEKSLALYNNYDITAALANAGIVSDNGFYAVADIRRAITALLGFAPGIECNVDPEGNRQLYQVYICVAKDGTTLIECPAALRKACKGSVQFPIFAPAAETEERADEL